MNYDSPTISQELASIESEQGRKAIGEEINGLE